MRRRGRLGISIVLIVSLLAAAGLRSGAMAWQARQSSGAGSVGNTNVGGMSSFALALLLGGLRGPLVMFLWSSSESQKNEHNLADFDTKVEWIRKLQPEFDTVLMFQIWNKAYNISVLMASPANKYTTIMQAIEYGQNVEKEKPGDLNILSSIANVYSQKLGAKIIRTEHNFYNRQLREETMTDEARKIAYPEDTSFTRIWKSSLSLDNNNNLLPELTKPVRPAPASATEWNDGSALQYLKPLQPFPYGIPPAAFAYNYAKRAQVAMTVEGQRPLQVSGMVIDTRPALESRNWAETERERARQAEARAFKLEIPEEENFQSDAALNNIPLTAPVDNAHELDEAIYSYATSATMARIAHTEYDRHLHHPEYFNRFQNYESHIDDVDEIAALSQADHDYLLALKLKDAPEAARLRATAAVLYRKAAIQSQRILIRYYVEDEIARVVFPHNMGREEASRLPDDQILRMYAQTLAIAPKDPGATYDEDRVPYQRNVNRSLLRLQLLQRQG